jgi:hypothetical protein
MSDDPRKGGGIFAAHAELIGRVTLMWSDVHAQVGQLFEDFCSSEEAQKRYWETQSDRTQRQLLLSVGSVALQDYPNLRERLEKTMAEIDRLAGDRNAATHTYWASIHRLKKSCRTGAFLHTSACARISRSNSTNSWKSCRIIG